ncbi:MAG: MATE family efflux transporter, partial [Bacteroidales bacterium]|nr:MATE family efflux transporter [Bacteroidales bacterium]
GILIAYVIYIFFMTKTSTIGGVWTAELFYNIAIGIISYLYIIKADWLKAKI